jgi:hypothetical protein
MNKPDDTPKQGEWKRQDLPKHEHREMPLTALEIPRGPMGPESVLDEGGEVHVYHDDGTFEIVGGSEESKKIWPHAKHTKHVKSNNGNNGNNGNGGRSGKA